MRTAGVTEPTNPARRAMRWGAGAVILLEFAAACAQAPASFTEALSAVKPLVDLRLRSEWVEQNAVAQDATALTLRSRLGLETGKVWQTALLAEADLLVPLETRYNSTVNGKTQFPVVADPETYEINRLQLTNTSLPDTTLIFGRQRINLDDQRFIGNVGWRQNEQTFDALRAINTSIRGLNVDVTYLKQVNRIFGKKSPVGRYRGDNYLINLAYPTPAGQLTGFIYLLDFEQAPTDSSRTAGLRLAGERTLQNIKFAYLAAWATQRERAGNPLSYRDDYYALELAGTLRRFRLSAGVEVLEGDGVKGFTTPLATLHKFQGWTDQFLTTPPNGIEDRYIALSYQRNNVGPLAALSAAAVYHRFDAQRLSNRYGSELGLQLQAKWRRFSALLKYADYNADGFSTDTRKLWAQIEFAR